MKSFAEFYRENKNYPHFKGPPSWKDLGKQSPEEALAGLKAAYSGKEGTAAAKDRVTSASDMQRGVTPIKVDDISTPRDTGIDAWKNVGKQSPEEALAGLKAAYSGKEGRAAAKDRVKTGRAINEPAYELKDSDVISTKQQKALPYKTPVKPSPGRALMKTGGKLLKKVPGVGTAAALATAQTPLDAAAAVDPTPVSTGLETSTAAANAVTNLNKGRMGRLQGPWASMRNKPAGKNPKHSKFFK